MSSTLATTGTLAALLLLGCAPQPATPAAAPVDQSPSDVAFDEGVLDPPFQSWNALWAGAAIIDFNADGWPDLYFSNGETHPDALYRNNGDGTFTDAAAAAGVDSMARHGALATGDVDGDGDPDLVVATECSVGSFNDVGLTELDGGLTVLRNLGDGTFQTEPMSAPENGDITAINGCFIALELVDVSGDGVLDLVAAKGVDPDIVAPWVFRKDEFTASDDLYFGDGQGQFFHAQVIGEEYTTTFAAAWVDVAGDGQPVLIRGRAGAALGVTAPQEDKLEDVDGVSPPTAGLWMGLAVADLDRDDDLDLYATNQGLSPQVLGYENLDGVELSDELEPLLFHTVFRNDGGALVATSPPVTANHALPSDQYNGAEPAWQGVEGLDRYGWGWGAVAVDVNADGWPDIASVGNNCSAPMDVIWDVEHGAGPGALLIADGEGGFVDRVWEAGVANVDDLGRFVDGRAILTGDLNRDGYPDLVVTNRSYNPSQSDPLAQEPGIPRVFLSQPRPGHWLQVDVSGTRSGPGARGATVTVETGDWTQRFAVGAGGGTGGASQPLVQIGLGDAQLADVIVRFPGGATLRLDDVEGDQRIAVSEADAQ
jgi:enediyne biosynthesis protein E4